MKLFLKVNLITAICFLGLWSSSALAANCNGLTTYPFDDTCGGYDQTPSTANGCPSPDTCEADTDNGNPDLYCCVNLASVPELPSWFGPFFLATLVAGWEYWRTHRRKIASEKAK